MASRDIGLEKCNCPPCPHCYHKLCTPNQAKTCHHTPNAHLKPIKVKKPEQESLPLDREPLPLAGPLPLASRELCTSPKIIAYGLSSACDQLVAVPYENEERYGFFEENPEIDLNKMRITSDLFHIDGAAFDFEEDIKVTIELNKRERRKFEDFFIFAKEGGNWTSVKAKYDIKTGILTFSIRRMNTFFAYSQQKVTKLNLTQKGAMFIADDDPNVHVNFPKDAVDGTRDLSIRVLDIDKGMQETMAAFPDLFGITYMSPCIFVDHDMKDKLKCPASVQVPFIPENIPKNQEFVIFHWGKNKVTIETGAASYGKGLCTLDTDEFSGVGTGLANKNGISDVALDIHTKMYKGQLKLCKILSFRDPDDRTSLYIDCCQLFEMEQRLTDLQNEGLREIPHSRSKDLYLIEAEKIKIHLKGCITYVAEVPKTYYCITYLSTCYDVHTNFPVKLAKKAGADPHAILIFETHGARAETRHVVHYDPDRLDNITVAFLPKPPDVPHRKTKTGPPDTKNKEKLTKKLDNQQMRGATKNPKNKIERKSEKGK